MTESTPTRRRWFQFSLATMFVVVTLVGCASGWVGSQLMLVHRRKEIVVRLNATVVTDEQEKSFMQQRMVAIGLWAHRSHDTPPPRLPFWRKWLGDNDRIYSITLPVEATAADMERLRGLYPEIHTWRRRRPTPPDEVYAVDYVDQKGS